MDEKTSAITFIVPESINKLIEEVAKKRGEDKSTFCRRAVYKELASLNFLDKETKKALGLEGNKEED